MKKLTTIALMLTCAALHAQVYSYVDSNGNTIYTDTPPKGQETRSLDIELLPSAKARKAADNALAANADGVLATSDTDGLKTVRLTPPAGSIPPNNGSGTPQASAPSFTVSNPTVSYQTLEIVKPDDKEMIPNTGGKIKVTVKSYPSLAAGHKYRALVDNKAVNESSSDSIAITNIERGEHTLAVEIIDADKNVLKTSNTQIFYIRQTNQADLRRVNPCKYLEYGVREECHIEDRPKIDPKLLRKITDKLGITKPCDLPDYGVRKDCPLKDKPKDPNESEEAKEDAETKK